MAKKATYEELERKVEELEKEFIKREQAEEALRKNEEKYRTLFEKSRDAIMITTTDGKFVDINQSTLDLFGYTRNDLMDLNVQQLYVDPEERIKLQKELGRTDCLFHLHKTDRTKPFSGLPIKSFNSTFLQDRNLSFQNLPAWQLQKNLQVFLVPRKKRDCDTL